MSVELQFNLRIMGDDESELSYSTGASSEQLESIEPVAEDKDGIEPSYASVLPLGSSVLAPGLSTHIGR
jgi:hypothetical protein